jgi:hypothetical protein
MRKHVFAAALDLLLPPVQGGETLEHLEHALKL